MNRTAVALLIKFAVTFFAAWITLGFLAGNPIGPVFWIALVGTVVNYLVGDLLILPGFGNTIASLGDGIMGAFVAFIMGIFFEGFFATFFGYFLYAVLIVVAEFIFHAFLRKSEKVAP